MKVFVIIEEDEGTINPFVSLTSAFAMIKFIELAVANGFRKPNDGEDLETYYLEYKQAESITVKKFSPLNRTLDDYMLRFEEVDVLEAGTPIDEIPVDGAIKIRVEVRGGNVQSIKSDLSGGLFDVDVIDYDNDPDPELAKQKLEGVQPIW